MHKKSAFFSEKIHQFLTKKKNSQDFSEEINNLIAETINDKLLLPLLTKNKSELKSNLLQFIFQVISDFLFI